MFNMKLQDTENIVLFLRALLLSTIQARRNNTLKLDYFFLQLIILRSICILLKVSKS